MKYFYLLAFAALLTAGCSKDFLKRYDRRIIGTWDLIDVDSRGIGGNTQHLPFRNGTFVFSDQGQLAYTDPTGIAFNGYWEINKNTRQNDETIRTLVVNATNFTTQEVRYEFFENMQFTGTNRFSAYIYSGAHTYVFRFRRR